MVYLLSKSEENKIHMSEDDLPNLGKIYFKKRTLNSCTNELKLNCWSQKQDVFYSISTFIFHFSDLYHICVVDVIFKMS